MTSGDGAVRFSAPLILDLRRALYAAVAVRYATTIDRLRAQKRDADTQSYALALVTNLMLNAGLGWLVFNRHRWAPRRTPPRC